MSEENKLKPGFSGMDFSGESKLFHKMPDYKSRTVKKRTINELRQTKDSVYKHPVKEKTSYEKLRREAEDFINKEHSNLKFDLNGAQFTDVISALVDYKNNH